MQPYAITIAGLATWFLALGVIGNTTARRVGGIRFFRLGRLCVSVCIARAQAAPAKIGTAS
jgi:hypothetical protein